MGHKIKKIRARQPEVITLLGNSEAADAAISASSQSEYVVEDKTQKTGINASGFSTIRAYLKARWWIVPVICVLAVAAFGGVLKYMEEAAYQQKVKDSQTGLKSAVDKQQTSFLNSINPFYAPPPPPPPPPPSQPSKEYIYAGSRLLAVEDGGTVPVPPPADLAVWRPSNGVWYIMNSDGTLFNGSAQWGGVGDIPVPGDYDGDGRTDLSVFRPSGGVWYIILSSNGSQQGWGFGQSGDKPAPADYDGDGKTDQAVVRNGVWYIQPSGGGGFYGVTFGNASDIPTPADFDGDGKADIAVWQNSTKIFYAYKSSSNNTQSESFVMPYNSTEPVAADFDGDGRADYAIRQQGTGNWVIRQSASGQIIEISWGYASDKAVQNDYDGDGRVDIAVWRETNGTWFIRNSSTGQMRTAVWGSSGDIPVPAFYRR